LAAVVPSKFGVRKLGRASVGPAAAEEGGGEGVRALEASVRAAAVDRFIVRL
jgi:hypothetical protein